MEFLSLTQRQTDVAPKQTSKLEPETDAEGKLECGICHRKFASRNDYDDHWLGCHRNDEISLASGSMGSMQSNSKQKCSEGNLAN
jgi:hypothetical protein